MNITDLLQECVGRNASDLHLSTGVVPMIRVDGELERLVTKVLVHDEILKAILGIMNPMQQDRLKTNLECDFSFEIPLLSRFRVNVFHQSRGISVSFRSIAHQIPSLNEINAPNILSDFTKSPRGLLLVTGPTGSGKSTTLAAMVDLLNQTTAQHILTIEDPIEFVHSPKKSLINQREVGSHTLSFSNALKSALREDPNVILVGEMRDLETIRLAITAAETGHLVLATLHTSGAAKTIDRMIDVFPSDEKKIVRTILSESLTAVISQVLCKRITGSGRIAAYEIMVGSSAIRHLIREGKVSQMYSAIQTGSALGMQTLDQSLSALVQHGEIDLSQARSKAQFPDNFYSIR